MTVKELLSAYEAKSPIRVRVRGLCDGNLITQGWNYRVVEESKLIGLRVAGFYIEWIKKDPVIIVEVW